MSTTNEQFLLCVIEHSQNGKVNWKEVGDVFGIKHSAASMRYSRMKKKFGTGPNDPGAATTADGSVEGYEAPRKNKKTPSKVQSSKRRKLDQDDDAEAVSGSIKQEVQEGDELA